MSRVEFQAGDKIMQNVRSLRNEMGSPKERAKEEWGLAFAYVSG